MMQAVPDPSPSVAPDLIPAEVLAQLVRILASPAFVNSERLCRFLRVTVERTLAGETDQLKEYSIGRDVFDRDEKYDPRIDSIVRVEARRLRAKLKLYYDKFGAADPVRIMFQQGSYTPLFQRHQTVAPLPVRSLDARTVAVLPFANLSPEPNQDYFCDGITDEIINTLAGVPDLKVIARTSMFHFRDQAGDVREIGRKLGVGTIIEGSVRKSGEFLRISTSVVDAATGHRLRTASFDRQMDAVFAIQDEIAQDIAASLEVALGQSTRHAVSQNVQDDLEAYNLLLHGRYLLNKLTPAGYRGAIDVMSRAAERFPAYGPFYPVLSEAFYRLYMWGVSSPQEAIPPARAAALEALRLDDRLPKAHLYHGAILMQYDWDWEPAAKEVARARELQPSSVTAHLFAATERFVRGHESEAIELLKAGIRLDPISRNANRSLALAYYYARRYDDAAEWMTRTLEIDPDYREAHYFMGLILLRRRMYDEAEDEFRQIADQPSFWTKVGAIAETYARAGRIDEARTYLAEWNSSAQSQYVPPLSCVGVYAALNDWDGVFAWLDRAAEERSAWLIFADHDPIFDPVRDDPRFLRLLRRMGLR